MTDTADVQTYEDLKKHITYAVSRLNAKLTAQASRVLRKHSSLSLSQWRLMAYLENEGPARLADFIFFAGFDKGQMSRVAQDLTKRGFLSVSVSEKDQRMQVLSLTPEGVQEYGRAAPFMRARRLKLLRLFSEAEHEQLLEYLTRLELGSEDFEAEF